MINLEDAQLVAIFGSWIRVQVAFYDFLFESSMPEDAATLTAMSREVMESGLMDGEELYEGFVEKIGLRFASAELAWNEFVDRALSANSVVR